MVPVSLTLSGFLSYRDAVTLDFTTFDLACIAGANGAGKSSLLDAITYALFGKARRTDDNVINLQSDSAFVELIFTYETNLYRVQRTNPKGKSTVLEFQIALPRNEEGDGSVQWKPLTERTVRDTQKKIEETLRLDYETFINAAFFLQGKADQFTQQAPARRKAILGSILGLEVWETYRQQALVRRRGVEATVQALDGRLAEISAELGQEQERLAVLNGLNEELGRLTRARTAQEGVMDTIRKIQATIQEQQRLVDAFGQQAERARLRLGQLRQRQASREEERQRYAQVQARETEIRAAHAALQEAQRRLAEWDAAARVHEQKRRKPLLAIEKALSVLETELAQLQSREAVIRGNEAVLAARESHLAGLQQQLSEVKALLAGRDLLEQQLAEARAKQAEARAENPRLKAEMDELKRRIDQLEASPEDAAACPVCGQPLPREHREELIAQLKAEGTERGDRFRANRELVGETDERVGQLAGQIRAFQEVEARERRLEMDRVKTETETRALLVSLEEWTAGGARRLAEVTALLEGEQYAPEARAELAAIDAELKATGYDVGEHEAIRAEVARAAGVEEEMQLLAQASAVLAPLERELGEIAAEMSAAQEDLAQQEKAQLDAVASLAVSQADAPDFAAAQRELLNLQEQENQVRMKVGSAQQKVDVLQSLRARKAALDAEREALAQKIAAYRQLERAFGKDGVPALLIEQALPQIEVKANELLERLSGGEMAVRFQTQRELKSREDLRETLDIIISDSAGTRDYEMFSGGEAFRVNFAIRLALSEVLAQRAGARLQTLVIDEGFGSQDELGRQRLIEAINMVRADFAKILVITHIEALKDAFPTRIEVTKGVGGSQVSLVSA